MRHCACRPSSSCASDHHPAAAQTAGPSAPATGLCPATPLAAGPRTLGSPPVNGRHGAFGQRPMIRPTCVPRTPCSSPFRVEQEQHLQLDPALPVRAELGTVPGRNQQRLVQLPHAWATATAESPSSACSSIGQPVRGNSAHCCRRWVTEGCKRAARPLTVEQLIVHAQRRQGHDRRSTDGLQPLNELIDRWPGRPIPRLGKQTVSATKFTGMSPVDSLQRLWLRT